MFSLAPPEFITTLQFLHFISIGNSETVVAPNLNFNPPSSRTEIKVWCLPCPLWILSLDSLEIAKRHRILAVHEEREESVQCENKRGSQPPLLLSHSNLCIAAVSSEPSLMCRNEKYLKLSWEFQGYPIFPVVEVSLWMDTSLTFVSLDLIASLGS